MTDQGGDQGHEALPPSSWLRRQFRDRPIVAWGLVAIGIGLIAAVVVIAAVHGTSEPKDTPITCTVYEQSSTLRLTIHSMVTKKEAEQGCGHSTKGLSSAATFFVVGTPPIPEEEPQEICALTSPDQPTTMIIEEVPGVLSKGERICGALAGEGWSQAIGAPEIGPGQREYIEAVEAEEAIEAEQRRETEIEEGEREEREQAIYACEEKAEATEERELEAIERETEERVAAAPESQEYEIEEEGYEREEEAYERELEAAEACEREAEAEAGETEYR
jgi:hypothetical protein